ncbi:hypothetical protein SAMN05660199_00618 [Klenkia soli]|uniref:VOC domain-containing protein n=1 Tax=Klenkia soli TaxID=1052260 RepID=A0A1H0E183_9ACTN|nr:hypothetical protein [Klenkia soli]SDN76046.1 hypothetical protein SAMN05660199_00618 [Klenkia soli]
MSGWVTGVLARVEVADLDAALPLYRELAGTDEVRRFRAGPVELAWVGDFLLLQGAPADLERVRRVATVLVTDAEAVAAAVTAVGGELLEGPAPGPNGPRLVARHPDGAVVEYVQPA